MAGEPRYPTIEIYKTVCIRCGACDPACPEDVFRIGTDGYPFAKYPDDCQACFLCEWDCPVNAIKISVHKWFKANESANH